MFETLVISKESAKENRTLQNLFVSTSFFVVSFLLLGTIFQLFSQSFLIGEDDLTLSTVLAPPVIESAPQHQSSPNDRNPTTENSPAFGAPERTAPRDRSDPYAIPDGERNIGTPTLEYEPQSISETGMTMPTSSRGGTCTANCTGIGGESDTTDTGKSSSKPRTERPERNPPEIPKPKKETINTSRVLNSKALNLVKPTYTSQMQKAAPASSIKVEILIDERGKVVSAKASNGHPLLRRSAERAARASRFSPTILNKTPVKVTGFIIYNFKK